MIGLDQSNFTAAIFDVRFEFHEVGGGDDHLISLVQKGLEDHIEATRGTHRHYDMLFAERKPGFLFQVLGDRLSRIAVTAVRHVAVHPWNRAVGKGLQCLLQGSRRFKVWVPEGKIVDVFLSVKSFQFLPFFEHPPHPGGTIQCVLHFLRNGHF